VATPSPDLLDAVGRLLRADPARALAVAGSLRAHGRSFESTVTGMSMVPTFAPGSRIRVALVPGPRYEAGDVVAFVAHERVIVHRVAHRGRAAAARGYLISLGDATLVPDPPVAEGHVLGAVTGVWRAGKWMPPGGRPRRSLRASAARTLSLAVAVGGLHVSPRATASALTWMHRVAGEIREAMARRGDRRPAEPPGAA
jgi:hypothetical protein